MVLVLVQLLTGIEQQVCLLALTLTVRIFGNFHGCFKVAVFFGISLCYQNFEKPISLIYSIISSDSRQSKIITLYSILIFL